MQAIEVPVHFVVTAPDEPTAKEIIRQGLEYIPSSVTNWSFREQFDSWHFENYAEHAMSVEQLSELAKRMFPGSYLWFDEDGGVSICTNLRENAEGTGLVRGPQPIGG